MVLNTYAELRHHFAVVVHTASVSLTYVDAAPALITRGAGSFVTDGFTAGMSVDVSGTALNDGRYTVGSVAALAITLESGDELTAEVITSSLTGAEYETDGAEKWPIGELHTTTFNNTWALTPSPATVFPIQVTVNALATDLSAGSSYTWYVRQKTDDVDLQWFTVAHADPLRTGTVLLLLTDKCVDDLGLAGGVGVKLSAEHQLRIMQNVTLFCQRQSDDAVQIIDLARLSADA